MKIYFFFGKAGSGKSYLADHLQSHYNCFHFDGDQILTPQMKHFITNDQIFTSEMLSNYMSLLKLKIKELSQNNTIPIIISQALYRNTNRLEILREFPTIQFVLISAPEQMCYQRIKHRNNMISVDYAKKISPIFEPPSGFHFLNINNDANNFKLLNDQVKKILFNSGNFF